MKSPSWQPQPLGSGPLAVMSDGEAQLYRAWPLENLRLLAGSPRKTAIRILPGRPRITRGVTPSLLGKTEMMEFTIMKPRYLLMCLTPDASLYPISHRSSHPTPEALPAGPHETHISVCIPRDEVSELSNTPLGSWARIGSGIDRPAPAESQQQATETNNNTAADAPPAHQQTNNDQHRDMNPFAW